MRSERLALPQSAGRQRGTWDKRAGERAWNRFVRRYTHDEECALIVNVKNVFFSGSSDAERLMTEAEMAR